MARRLSDMHARMIAVSHGNMVSWYVGSANVTATAWTGPRGKADSGRWYRQDRFCSSHAACSAAWKGSDSNGAWRGDRGAGLNVETLVADLVQTASRIPDLEPVCRLIEDLMSTEERRGIVPDGLFEIGGWWKRQFCRVE